MRVRIPFSFTLDEFASRLFRRPAIRRLERAASHDSRAFRALLDGLRVWDSHEAAAEALGRVGDKRAVLPLLVYASGFNQDRGLAALVKIRAIDELLEALDYKPGMLIAGIHAPEPPEEPCVDVSDSCNKEIAATAATALGCIGDRKAVIGLLKALRNQSNRLLQFNAAGALGDIGDPRAVKPLISTLAHHDSLVRSGACFGLSRFSGHLVESALAAALESERDRKVKDKLCVCLETVRKNRLTESGD